MNLTDSDIEEWERQAKEAYEEERKALITNRCCIICKHCFYTGLPGAYGCTYRVFTDIYDSCDKWELKEDEDEVIG